MLQYFADSCVLVCVCVCVFCVVYYMVSVCGVLFVFSFEGCYWPENSRLTACVNIERGIVPGDLVVYVLLGPLILHHIQIRFIDGIAGEKNTHIWIASCLTQNKIELLIS